MQSCVVNFKLKALKSQSSNLRWPSSAILELRRSPLILILCWSIFVFRLSPFVFRQSFFRFSHACQPVISMLLGFLFARFNKNTMQVLIFSSLNYFVIQKLETIIK